MNDVSVSSLKGKSAVITGSTSGIGAAIASVLADQGVNIMLNGFGEADAIESQRQALEAKGVKATFHGADMRQPSEIADMIKTAEKSFDGVDIVVNNAGIQHVEKVEDFPVQKWDDIIAINMSSAFHTIQAVVPGMKARGWGRIINLASVHGVVASPFKSAYVTAKHGVVGLTKTVGLELAEYGITVNAVCPGYVKTPLVEGQIDDTAKARGLSRDDVVRDVLLKAQWTKKFVEPDHVAELVAFLCSDAAANMTGSAQLVDGGWSAA